MNINQNKENINQENLLIKKEKGYRVSGKHGRLALCKPRAKSSKETLTKNALLRVDKKIGAERAILMRDE